MKTAEQKAIDGRRAWLHARPPRLCVRLDCDLQKRHAAFGSVVQGGVSFEFQWRCFRQSGPADLCVHADSVIGGLFSEGMLTASLTGAFPGVSDGGLGAFPFQLGLAARG